MTDGMGWMMGGTALHRTLVAIFLVTGDRGTHQIPPTIVAGISFAQRSGDLNSESDGASP